MPYFISSLSIFINSHFAKYFKQVFSTGCLISRSLKSPITQKRIQNIIEYMTFEVFRYAVRGLYEVDKLTYTLLLALKIDLQANKVKHDEFFTLIKGDIYIDFFNDFDCFHRVYKFNSIRELLTFPSKLSMFDFDLSRSAFFQSFYPCVTLMIT